MLGILKHGSLVLISSLALASPSFSVHENRAPIDEVISVFELVDTFRLDTRYLLDSADSEAHLPLIQNAEVLAILADEFHYAVHVFGPQSWQAASKFNDIRGIFINIALILSHDEFSVQTINDFEFLNESFSILDEYYSPLP